MNIMADPKTLKLTAFIDPCTSIWADREYDLFQLRNMWEMPTACTKPISKSINYQNMQILG